MINLTFDDKKIIYNYINFFNNWFNEFQKNDIEWWEKISKKEKEDLENYKYWVKSSGIFTPDEWSTQIGMWQFIDLPKLYQNEKIEHMNNFVLNITIKFNEIIRIILKFKNKLEGNNDKIFDYWETNIKKLGLKSELKNSSIYYSLKLLQIKNNIYKHGKSKLSNEEIKQIELKSDAERLNKKEHYLISLRKFFIKKLSNFIDKKDIEKIKEYKIQKDLENPFNIY